MGVDFALARGFNRQKDHLRKAIDHGRLHAIGLRGGHAAERLERQHHVAESVRGVVDVLGHLEMPLSAARQGVIERVGQTRQLALREKARRDSAQKTGGSRISPASAKRQNTFVMDGPKVWDFAVVTVPRTIRSLLDEHGLQPSDLDLVILHQSNLRMIEAIMTSLALPMARTVTTVEAYGNTAAASIPLTLAKAAESERLRPGARVMLCGFGGRLS